MKVFRMYRLRLCGFSRSSVSGDPPEPPIPNERITADGLDGRITADGNNRIVV